MIDPPAEQTKRDFGDTPPEALMRGSRAEGRQPAGCRLFVDKDNWVRREKAVELDAIPAIAICKVYGTGSSAVQGNEFSVEC